MAELHGTGVPPLITKGEDRALTGAGRARSFGGRG